MATEHMGLPLEKQLLFWGMESVNKAPNALPGFWVGTRQGLGSLEKAPGHFAGQGPGHGRFGLPGKTAAQEETHNLKAKA